MRPIRSIVFHDDCLMRKMSVQVTFFDGSVESAHTFWEHHSCEEAAYRSLFNWATSLMYKP